MKNLSRRLIAIFAAGAIMLTGTVAFAVTPGLSNFRKVNVYQEGMFSDVGSDHWAKNNVKLAYEVGIMMGAGSQFNLNNNVSEVEVITMAARLHSIYHTGKEEFQQGTPWYQCYLDYARENGIISESTVPSGESASRYLFVDILHNAFPADGFKKINEVSAIPDVSRDNPINGEGVYQFYEAGILTGSGSDGAFHGVDYIRRSEAAAIISRMVDESLRIRNTPTNPKQYYQDDPLVLDFGYYCNVDLYQKSKNGSANVYLYETYYQDGEGQKVIDFHQWQDRLEGEGFVHSGGEEREGGYASIYIKGDVVIKAGIYKTNYFMIEVEEKGRPAEPPEEESEISTVQEMAAYLNANWNKIETPMGEIPVETTIQVNNRSYNLYDWWIQSEPPSTMIFFELKYSVEYTAEEKEGTIEALRAYQKGLYNIVSKYFPDKKVYGGYYLGSYKYPNLQVGYQSTQAFSWMNYTPDEYMGIEDDAYYSSKITDFHWVSTYDNYFFE